MKYSKKAFVIIGFIVIIASILIFIIRFNKVIPYELATVQSGPVTEHVSASGKVEPSTKIDLHFKNSGQLASLAVAVGDTVKAGQLLAKQDTAQLDAQVLETRSSVDLQRAKLNQLIIGASPEEIALAEVALQNATRNYEEAARTQENLVQTAYTKLLNTSFEAWPVDDASDDPAPTISGTYMLGKEGSILVSSYYSAGGVSFRVSGLTTGSGSGNAVVPEPLGNSGLYITFPSSTRIKNKDWIIEIPNKKTSNYLTNLTAYETALQTKQSTLSAAKSLIDQKQAELSLKRSGARPADIAVFQAQISQAEASLQKILAQRNDLALHAPINSVVTNVIGEIGETIRPEQSVVSLSSGDTLQLRLNVVEDGIVKVRVGQKADITFDAIKHETFPGTVISIDPAETVVGGAVYYETIVAFDTPDERLRSGMTANILIETAAVADTLTIPQSAIEVLSGQTRVQVFVDGVVEERIVITGLKDRNGQIEIVSGLEVGEQVIIAKIK
jgi:HlyD family secretion protein